MVISHAKKFVILAPWKTASSTLHNRMAAYNESPYSVFYDYNIHLQRVVHQHLTCADFAGLPESRLGHFVASFVRNPYDRVYSGFLQVQRDIAEQPFAPFPSSWIRALVKRQLEANLAQLRAAGFDFDRWVESLQDFQIYEIGHNSSFPMHPGHYWTHLAGQQVADFVGRVENFETDFSTICSMIGIDEPERLSRNVSDLVPQENDSGHGYRYIHLMKRSSIDRINDLFGKDFEMFGYEIV
jgi:hypothetical protein